YAVVDRREARVLRRLEARWMLPREVDEEVVEIDPAEEEADRRQDDVFDQRVDNRRQGHAQNKCESQSQNVRFEKELLELGHHGQNLHPYAARRLRRDAPS